ncbi:CLUMA_CG000122, isoform A [Clunio marinus]|uniref:CLUMA_CG000122, isoform A n=1 Tax=Clunio marinus TaxID=568069 RepID=A0A1J1HGD3_9DIPT|nr:CLUMA_CG000122, isoform A [Clunio marinus]
MSCCPSECQIQITCPEEAVCFPCSPESICCPQPIICKPAICGTVGPVGECWLDTPCVMMPGCYTAELVKPY